MATSVSDLSEYEIRAIMDAADAGDRAALRAVADECWQAMNAAVTASREARRAYVSALEEQSPDTAEAKRRLRAAIEVEDETRAAAYRRFGAAFDRLRGDSPAVA